MFAGMADRDVWYLTLDQGTTSSRALVFDRAGGVCGLAAHEFEQFFPAAGCVEHDAEGIWATQLRAMEEAWEAAGRPDIAAVGIANQRETVVVWDRATGEPVHRAIVWQDRRTAGELAGFSEEQVLLVRALTGLPVDPYFSAAKIAWILDHVDGARARAEKGELAAGTIDTWLMHKLTGGAVHVTEPSNASRTSLFDIEAGAWSEELCALFRVPRAILPEVRPSAGTFGTVAVGAGAARGWPITGVLGDQQAALFGHGATTPGDSKCTYGTGAFWLTNAGTTRPDPAGGLLATVAWQLPGEPLTYAIEGSVLISGALIQWLRDGLQIIESAAEVEALARSVPDSNGAVIVPAFAGLGTPHWDSEARGLIAGLTRGVTKAHLARAALEAMALQVDDVLRAVTASLDGPNPTSLGVDGGATANDLLMEIQAAVSGVSVERAANAEMTAWGACRAAMCGIGADSPPRMEPGVVFEPDASVADVAVLRAQWHAAVEGCRNWTKRASLRTSSSV